MLPFSWIYYIAYLIKYHLLSFPKKLNKPVICVGNVTIGGAGKTEVALALGRLCMKLRLKPAFIAHGYNSAIEADDGFVLVDQKLHNSHYVGDEALLLTQLAPTYLAKNRLLAAKAAEKNADILIFDDGMQNNKFYKDITFSVINGEYLFGNQLLMPAGPLREPISSSIKKTDCFIITYCDKKLDDSKEEIKMIKQSNKPLLYLKTEVLNAKQIAKKSFILMCGICNPENFIKTLKALKITIIEHFIFADHHQYTDKELEHISMLATEHNTKIITTAKDVVRIPHKYHQMIEIVRLHSEFDNTKELAEIISNSANHSLAKNKL